jgi:hypothetical protein
MSFLETLLPKRLSRGDNRGTMVVDAFGRALTLDGKRSLHRMNKAIRSHPPAECEHGGRHEESG